MNIDVKGAAPYANDPHHATATLDGVPRKDDQISVWTGDEEVYIEVETVTWPTWVYPHAKSLSPELWLRRPNDLSDEEWADVFAAIKEGRKP